MRLETDRLILRELCDDDFESLHEILSDPETMRHYPAPFDAAKTRQWIEWNKENYAQYGFGLWAVVLKDGGRVIGDAGMTMQPIHGQMLPEIGYHIHKGYQRKGYATEAAAACMRYAFQTLKLPAVYSYMKYTNEASCSVALKNGMRFVEQYADPVNAFTRVYAITREEWEQGRQSEGDSKAMIIREMTAADAQTVVGMMRTFYASPAVSTNGSEAIFQADVAHCVGDCPYLEGFVFCEGEAIVGYAMVAKSFSTEFGKPCIWIEDLYVVPQHRSLGVGQRFLAYATQRYPGCVLRLEVESENQAAIRVYQKSGFSPLPYLEMKKDT